MTQLQSRTVTSLKALTSLQLPRTECDVTYLALWVAKNKINFREVLDI